jgi:lipoprotein-anchoring transpeptidase ErfK/SrfK
MRRVWTIVAGAAVLLAGCGGASESEQAAAPSPTPTPKHFTPAQATPTPTATPDVGRYLVAALKQPAQLREKPGGAAVVRVATKTEFGSPTVLSVVGQRKGWLRVLHPALDNGKTGWIPATDAELQSTDFEIRIDRSDRTARLRNDGKTVMTFTVAVGRDGNETPLGRFAVTDKLRPADAQSPYGCCAVALTGHQPKLVPGWPGGDRLAIHHTPAEGTVGQAASLGCLRAARKPMERLMRRLPLGTPVFVRA